MESNNPFYKPGSGYVGSIQDSITFGGNFFPNEVETGIQWGRSESFVIRRINLW
jgi:hypothetical protein